MQIQDHSVVLQKNGKLWFVAYDTDEFIGYAISDATEEYKKHLFCPLVFGPETTLKDLLLFARRDISFWESIVEGNDLNFLRLPLLKAKETRQDHIDEIVFYQYIDTFGEKDKKSGEISLNAVGFCNTPDVDDQIEFGIDHQIWNLYLDKPLNYSRNSKIYIDESHKQYHVGIIQWNLIDVVRMALNMSYATVLGEADIEYTFNWDTESTGKT
jgi:hypothetical protein